MPQKTLLMYLPHHFYTKKIIFVHIPKNSGISISVALYNTQHDHRTALFYKKVDPGFFAATPSFALIRNPYDRTMSAYFFTKNGGGSHVALSAFWHWRSRNIRNFDDYLYWVNDVMQNEAMLDFTMRRQTDYVCDDQGRVIVSDLFSTENNEKALLSYLAKFGVKKIPKLNITDRSYLNITRRQRSMIERIYEKDFELFFTKTELQGNRLF